MMDSRWRGNGCAVARRCGSRFQRTVASGAEPGIARDGFKIPVLVPDWYAVIDGGSF